MEIQTAIFHELSDRQKATHGMLFHRKKRHELSWGMALAGAIDFCSIFIVQLGVYMA